MRNFRNAQAEFQRNIAGRYDECQRIRGQGLGGSPDGGWSGFAEASTTTLATASPAAPATAAAAGVIPALPSEGGPCDDAAAGSGRLDGRRLAGAEAVSSLEGLARCSTGVLWATKRMPGSRFSVSISRRVMSSAA
ncbi:MAG: hypothetical protein QOG61_1946, partial [Candidatus Binataceae bacterium]|nr:hypothetical protein [Candidatus Binataceae bacterium]